MPGTGLLNALTDKYAKLLGELEFADRSVMDAGQGLAAFDEAVYQVARVKKDLEEKLAAIETVIWMFNPDWDPSGIRPHYPRKSTSK